MPFQSSTCGCRSADTTNDCTISQPTPFVMTMPPTVLPWDDSFVTLGCDAK